MLCKEVYGEPEEEDKSAGGIESYSVIGKDAIDILEKYSWARTVLRTVLISSR